MAKPGASGKNRRTLKRSKTRLDLSPKGVQKMLAKQRAESKDRQDHKKAAAARNAFKPAKKDFGKLVLIGVKGKRNPQAKGRKGYLVYVTRTGKPRLIRQPKHGFKPTKLKQVEVPIRRNLKSAVRSWQKARRATVGTGEAKRPLRAALPGKVKSGGAYDFNDKIVGKLAKAFKGALESRRSKRDFIINASVTVRLPNGEKSVYRFDVPLQRADHHAIKLAGVKSFVERKFYAFLARELAFDGFVTAGSANHIRRLADNKDVDDDDLVQDDGEAWRGIGMDVVTIESIEWEIEQVQ